MNFHGLIEDLVNPSERLSWFPICKYFLPFDTTKVVLSLYI